MFMLQQFINLPPNPDDFELGTGKTMAVDGFDSLADFGLNAHRITKAAIANQDANNGYLAVPSTDDFLAQFQDLDPTSLNFGDSVMFNFPYCDLGTAVSPAATIDLESNFVEENCKNRASGSDEEVSDAEALTCRALGGFWLTVGITCRGRIVYSTSC
jgi:hypothetical protein